MAEGTAIGSLIVRIGADADDLLSTLKKADSGFGSFGKNVKIAHDAVAAFAGAAAAVGTTLAVLVTRAAGTAEEMRKMAQSAGMATETFSEYVYVARLANIGSEQLGSSISKLNRNIAEAADGTGTAAAGFKTLGLEAKNADGSLKSADKVMEEVADKFATFVDGPEKSAIAIMLFGKAGAAMIPMLNEGSAKMRALRDEAKALGVTVDSETGKAAEEFRDNLTRLGQVQQGLANGLMRELLPALNLVTGELVTAASTSGALHKDIKSLADVIQTSVLVVFQTLAIVGSEVAFVFKMIGGEIGVWGAQLAALARLDFAGFRLIGKEWTADAAQARRDLDDFQARVMGVKKVVADPAPGGAMDMGVGLDFMLKGKAPRIQSEEERKALEKRNEELIQAMIKAGADQDTIQRALNPFHLTEKEMEERSRRVIENFIALRDDVNAKIARQMLAPTMDDDSLAPEKDAKLIALRQSLKTSEQIENEAHALKMAQLSQFSEAELQHLGGKQAVIQQMEEAHQERLSNIQRRGITSMLEYDKASALRKAQFTAGYLADLTATVASGNKKMFEINKIAGIANVALTLPEKISDAFKWGNKIGGPYVGYAFAAVAAAAGLAHIQQMRAQTFGGGGAAPSVAGSTPATPVTPVTSGEPGARQARGPDTIVHLHGETFDRASVRNLLKQFEEEGRDGGRIIVAN